MEFRRRKELSGPPFNLDLSGAELWDLVRADILQPFTRVQPGIQYLPIDPISCDPAYEPLFPTPIAEKYRRLRWLQYEIETEQKFIDKSEEQAWKDYQLNSKKLESKTEKELDSEKESYLRHFRSAKEEARQSLEANKKEVAILEKEFKDIPKLYEEHIANMTSDSEREYFMKKVDDAYFRRDQIEGVIEAEFKHSPDYSTASYKGKKYEFTYKQAHAIRLLHEAQPQGISQHYILEEIESSANRLRDVFRDNLEAYNDLIVRGKRKGVYRLNI